ncbi:hypothetical protein WJN01_13180 [Flavobacteriaceae bacterium SZ-1-7]|uniref:hypothetical protein n=1 Tax=Tamlana sedimenti TaxID=3134126 RepID=UPI003121189A
MKIKKDIIPLSLAVILLMVSVVITSFTEYMLTTRHHLAIVLTVLSAFFYFRNKKVYVYIFGITLLLGSAGIVGFYHVGFHFAIGAFKIPFISFSPIPFALLIIFLYFNKSLIDQVYWLFSTSKTSEYEKQDRLEAKIKRFEQKFADKTTEELKQIVDLSNPYVDEARIAAQRLLNQR